VSEQQKTRLEWMLGERVKELTALHEAARIVQHKELTIPELLSRIAALLPPAFQFPKNTAARIRWDTHQIQTNGFLETPLSISASVTLARGDKLDVTVACFDLDTSDPVKAFLPEEQLLIESIAELIAGTLDSRIAQERLELALEGTGAGVWEWEIATDRVIWSELLERLAGLPPGGFGGTLQAFRNLVHAEDADLVTTAVRGAIDGSRQGFSMELRIRHQAGGYRWLASTGKVFRDASGRVERVLGLATDCTARRELEDQLRQAQRMEAIGGLAAGIAHDFNNVLSVVLSYAEIALLDLAPGAALRPEIEEIRAAGLRAGELTRQLLAFSRQQVLSPRVFDLNQTLTGLQKMLRRLLPEDIDLTILPAANLGRVNADPGQIEQVILNLVVNARDAMPDGGKLLLETHNVELDASYAADHLDATAGPQVLLAVTDTGTGMSPEVRARIFEPFFTTKEQGKGTGLGLATVFGIVRQSGGHLAVYSEVGTGTAFKLYLPRVDRPEEPTLVSQRPKVLTGNETILLAEDEPQVRSIATRILRRNGYRVWEAQSPSEALEIAEKQGALLDVLLTDVVMPQMSGRKLAEQLATRLPRLKVLYMSGYTDDAIIRHGILEPGVSFIQKPLTPGELLLKLRALLDS
jgi:two-component system, cell cycle sensor histidine kinase and response regulator CckA